ncbi:NAD(P)-dependent dehydrogenase (short-subunit alcohol dehydrogenase family)/pimeloyl-ACP methyl ester carboxylesterase [Nocardiopsis mwathae]|uniref:NAD(P)-dependent dehydrogenase (Short-subunit alcohol dehydrogenase family)/pimeloyl-ACP methyl ester carboxylesterase n=1 Tax=Nocardiopsis mwathae TaxID=1472723 RepID=A0A7X0D473_9ACTN|nr:SDR family oxidoreductase [Nocardiopsis mwathae]MBB6170451.1 NAD(P)-dependent dehydrogenase (short-subunit alcohol dehydrogenase family)/pimeloyl-ACP methyl ester carboxylesterase [Nocardiopsis mwathae]
MSETPHPRHVWTADGLRLAVYHRGDPAAPTVLCVHGYPDNASVWDGVAEHLADRYHVVTYDVRGAGASTAPRQRSGYRMEHLADDLARVADAVSPGRPVHLLAHDWGSLQAWHAVTDERLSARFASFTSISGPCLDHVAHWIRSGLRAGNPGRLLSQSAHSTYIGFFHLPALPELSWLTGVGGLVLGAAERVGESGRPRVRARRHMRDFLNGLELYRANIRDHLRRPGRRSTSIPVQVLAPTREAFMPEGAQTAAAEWVPDFRFHRLDGGHWAPRTRPGVIARRVTDLVEEVDAGRAPAPRATAGPGASPGPRRFAGQLAVVTGAGGGIGRATAFELAEQGARIIAVDIDEQTAARTADLASLLGPAADSYRLDVADGAAMDRFAKWVRAEHGVPDIVINNAGIGIGGPFLGTTPADWERAIDVNLWGVIHGCRAFAPMMVESGGGGRIVNTASCAAYLPSRAFPAYATTKAAVLMLSRCLRGELAEHGIRVTAVCPGVIHTGIIAATRFAGADDRVATAARERLERLYRMRGYTPERAARRIVHAIGRGPELLPITGEAHGGLLLSRLAPAVLRATARLAPPLDTATTGPQGRTA